MFEKKVVKLAVYVELDQTPGVFHTKESARESVEAILKDRIPHYNPDVRIISEHHNVAY